MRTTIFLLFFSVLITQASNSYSQETKFSLRLKSASIKDICKEIEAKSDYIFVFSDNTKKSIERKVNVEANSKNIMDVLDAVLSETGLSYRVIDKQIVVYLSDKENTIKEKPFPVLDTPIQEKIITGTIVDKDKNPLPGVSIRIVGEEAKGTITDVDGHFNLNVPDKNTIVEISFIGYKTQKINVGKDINFYVVLEEDLVALDEVVVTGYGSQKRASVIGAIETIQPQKLRVGSTRSMSNNLAGQIAGIIAVQRSGEPGKDNSSFWIRGISSFSGNQNPLVLVDGIERDLNNIDPAEIESFSVLKDASASAMYGVRGANGVIVINTKRGTVGKPTVNFRVEHAISNPTKLPDYVNAVQYMELRNKLAVDQSDLPFALDRIEKTRTGYDPDIYPDVNWIDEVTKDYAYSTRGNMTVNGGSDFLRYALIASLYNEKGIIETDRTLAYDTGINLNRYNVRANVDVDITKTTTLRLNVGGYMQEHRGSAYSTDDILHQAFTKVPYEQPARYSDGKVPYKNVSGNNANNPWGMATQFGYSTNTASQIQSLFSLEQDLKMITSGLKAKGVFSFDSYSYAYRNRSVTPSRYDIATARDEEGNLIHSLLSYGDESMGLSSGGNYGNKRTYLEGQLTYRHLFGLHDIDGLFLYNQQSYDDGSVQPFRKQGIAGRFSYMFDSRYIAEFNFGYNGSENFAKGKRFGFFPSFAVGWLMSEERFMESIKSTINKLKLRGSYGKVGNDDIGGRRFAYMTTVSSVNAYQFGENHNYAYTGYTEGQIGVDNLTWETSWKTNLGFELGLWNELNLQFDLFKENRSNIFMQRSTIPTQTGYITFPWANYGKVENKGVDVSLDFNKSLNKDWALGFRSTFTYAKNKVIEKDEALGRLGTYRAITGLPMNTLWGLTAERLFTDDDFYENGDLKEGIPMQYVGSTTILPGDIKYVDMNGDGQITEEDEGYIGGTVDPKLVYGFGGNVIFRDWDLNFFFQGMGDTYRLIGGSANFMPGSDSNGNIFSNYTDAWTEENPSQNVFYPRLSATANQNNYRASTWWKKNMSFLRVKTIELGYNLPEPLSKKANCKSIRLYVSGNNLFYFSKFKLWDPELSSITGGKYPQMRSVMFGVDINF